MSKNRQARATVEISPESAAAIRNFAKDHDVRVRDAPAVMRAKIDELSNLASDWCRVAEHRSADLAECQEDRDAIDAERKAKVEELAKALNDAYHQGQELQQVREAFERAASALETEKRMSGSLLEARIDEAAADLPRTRIRWAILGFGVASVVAAVVHRLIGG